MHTRWSLARAAFEIGSYFLMATAALLLIATLLKPLPSPPVRAEAVKGLSIAAAELSNVTGTGPLALVEFSDFECPACAGYATKQMPAIIDAFVRTGKLRYVAFNFPLEKIHPLARKAAEAVECAARQGRFWEGHKELFARSPNLELDSLSSAAIATGVDSAAFVACVTTGATADRVDTDLRIGQRLGVRGTPSFFVGRVGNNGDLQLEQKVVGAISVGQLQEVLGKDVEGTADGVWARVKRLLS